LHIMKKFCLCNNAGSYIMKFFTFISFLEGKCVPVLNYHAMKVYCVNGDAAPRILNLCTRWR
jgi:hypothetical protein